MRDRDRRFPGKTLLVVLLALIPALPAAAQSTSITTARIDGVWVDIDQSGNPTCGDAIDFTVSVAAASSANALNTELVLPIDPKTNLDPTSVVVTAPQGNPQVVRADSVLDVVFGTVCGPSPCSPSTVRFRTYIAFPATGPDVFEQGTVSASNAATVNTNSFFQPFVSCGAITRPDLALTKSDGGLTADPGQVIPYTLTVLNQGNATASTSVLTEAVPAGTTFHAAASSPGWACSGTTAGSTCSISLGNVVPGATVTKFFAVTADLPFPVGTAQVSNSAAVSTAVQESNLANNSATDTTPVRPGTPDLRLVKTVTGGAATPGTLLFYGLTLTNLGNATARSTSITETVPQNTSFVAASSTAGWSCSAGTGAGSSCSLATGDLAPGQAVTATFAVRLDDPLPAGVVAIANTACASTTTSGDPAGNDCGSVTTPAQGTPALSLKKVLASGTGTPGSTLVYTLTATNNGNQGTAGVVLSETVPANTTFSAAASSPGWSCAAPTAGSPCTLPLGTLAGGGASLARSFAVVIDNPLPAGTMNVQNTACAASGNLRSCATLTVPTNGAPALSLTKTLSSGTGAPGSALIYALTVTNSGNQATALRLSETVPAHTTFLPASSSHGWTCTPDDQASASCAFSILNLAGGGASTTVLFAVRIDSPLPAGVTQIANTACFQKDSGSSGCDQITTPTTGRPILGITKTLTAGTPAPGSTLAYTLTVTNTGDQDAAGVTLSDQLPGGTTFVPALSSPGWTCSPTNDAPSTCTVSIGALPASASASRTIALRLADPWPAGSTILSNTGCATDSTGKLACSSIDTPIDAAPVLSLTKSYSGPPLQAGASLAFDLAVGNTGNQVATGVLLRETVPAHTTFTPSASSPDWSCSSPAAGSSCTLTLATLAPGETAHRTFAVVVVDPLPPGVSQVSNSACASLPRSGPQIHRGIAGDAACSQATTPLAVALDATLTADLALDANHNSFPETGDVLLYTLVVTNPSGGAAQDVEISVASLDPHLQMVPESIITSAGSVSAPASLTDPIVRLPSLASGASVTITFRAQVTGALPPALRFLASQGFVSGANITALPTDDPATPEVDDPTRTPLAPQGPPVHDVPTLSDLGLICLAFALAGTTLCFLRRRAPAQAKAER
jgi:uncharacterized repeat protein (TIGR01451 family)